MKPKLLVWIDSQFSTFGLAKSLQEMFSCELFSIIEITNEPKKFFKEQQIVKFKKTWFYYDFILKTKRTPDLNYLKSVEEKYKIPLWLIAANDRIFNHYNKFYTFSSDEILSILEDEIKLYEMILDEVKPDFIIMPVTHQQHNHIFYKICKARNIKILMMVPTRTSIITDSLSKQGNMWQITDEMDKFLPLPKSNQNKHKKNIQKEKIEIADSDYLIEKFSATFQTSRSKFFKAFLRFLFTKDTNVQTHYTYFGRSKIKVILKTVAYKLRKKYRENFMEKNLSRTVESDSPFVYFPLHQEQERITMIGAPFYINQIEVVQKIAQSLPVGYKLYVKDHTVMRVRGWRSISEMKKIMGFYNVKLLHPLVNSNEIIKKCDLVISIKGSSVIEAAFHNKPSIAFENVGSYQLSSIHRLQSVTELPQAIRNSLKKKVNQNEFRKYIDVVNEHSFKFLYTQIAIDFEDQFKIGGYYANVEMDPQKVTKFLEKFKLEFTQLAAIYIEKIKQLSN
jgi:hypothetical protein